MARAYSSKSPATSKITRLGVRICYCHRGASTSTMGGPGSKVRNKAEGAGLEDARTGALTSGAASKDR